jgi:alkanesulfonate monooxygenase SsuD/methylene tetrahydromethanopterin reductase-like flavin-dependent oxidoreductase (luciferase family)
MQMLARSIIGSPDTVRTGLAALLAETGADELMVVSDVYDHPTRLRSYELIAASHAEHVSTSAMDGVA